MFNFDLLYRLSLYIAIIGLAAWGASLILAPLMVHTMTNPNPMNAGTSGTLGAALVGLAVILLFIAIQPRTILLAAAIGFGLLVAMRAYLMFITGQIHASPMMLVVLAISILVAAVILIKAFDPGAERES
jgi:FtsH-binding integral membrane protein